MLSNIVQGWSDPKSGKPKSNEKRAQKKTKNKKQQPVQIIGNKARLTNKKGDEVKWRQSKRMSQRTGGEAKWWPKALPLLTHKYFRRRTENARQQSGVWNGKDMENDRWKRLESSGSSGEPKMITWIKARAKNTWCVYGRSMLRQWWYYV